MSKTKADPNYKVIAENRRARFDYAIESDLECGVVLLGSEVKSLRIGGSNIAESYAQIENGVDFFDNLEGGVTRGFTTKVVPGEHQTEYLKFYEGTPVGPRSHSGTYYADLNPIESRSSIYRDSSGNYVLPDTGVNTNPPGTESGILKFTPPQTTLNLEDGFSNDPFSVSARPSDSPTLSGKTFTGNPK